MPRAFYVSLALALWLLALTSLAQLVVDIAALVTR